MSEPNWERQTLEKVALAAVEEQRRSRRWSILFKALTFVYLFAILFAASGWFKGDGVAIAKKHTALVDLQGEISARGASADHIIGSLQDAFDDPKTQGVILRINSPGGSPVQAGQIHDEIKRLRAKYPKIPLYVVVDDMCASGGYYVAAAADQIFVDKASLVGSIGVLMNGFGFTGAMQKLGVERRLITAGENKGFMDPFSPLSKKQEDYARGLLADIHKQFIEVVREGRGERLKETPETFSGLVWSGEQSVHMGLADGYGSTDSVARDVIKAETIVDFTRKDSFAERLAERFGAAAAHAFSPLASSPLE